jgi:diaminopimelate decarboxylase
METDILAERIDLLAVEVGDVLCLRDVGAYDYSMRYAFGRGAKGQLS